MNNNSDYKKIPSVTRHSKGHSKGKTSKVNPQKGSKNNSRIPKSGTRKIAFNNRQKSEKKESLVENLLRTIREDEEKLAKVYAELAKARQERYYEMKKSSNLSRAQLPHDVLGDY